MSIKKKLIKTKKNLKVLNKEVLNKEVLNKGVLNIVRIIKSLKKLEAV